MDVRCMLYGVKQHTTHIHSHPTLNSVRRTHTHDMLVKKTSIRLQYAVRHDRKDTDHMRRAC